MNTKEKNTNNNRNVKKKVKANEMKKNTKMGNIKKMN